jgi:hypothetical protein
MSNPFGFQWKGKYKGVDPDVGPPLCDFIGTEGLALAGATDYEIERSLRFNRADSANLTRTPAGVGTSRRIWTFATWLKRGTLGVAQAIFAAGTGATAVTLSFNSSDQLVFDQNGTSIRTTSRLFRDTAAWYHIVLMVDTTQATASNRTKVYVNGEQITAFAASSDFALNSDLSVNNTVLHRIGNTDGSVNHFDGYLADVYLADGQALTPFSFGRLDGATGSWLAKRYGGTFGTNGFYLNFRDNSGTTSTTLGKDQAGSNNWTPNNFSVSAGVDNDSLEDTPTNNFCTMSAADRRGSATLVFRQGNLQVTWGTAAEIGSVRGTFAVRSGKWYFEITKSTTGSANEVGIVAVDADISSTAVNISYIDNGNKRLGGSPSAYGATWTLNDVIGCAFDVDNLTIEFFKNGASQGSFSFSANAAGFAPVFSDYTAGDVSNVQFNFGQRPFVHAAPAGYKTLCSANLPVTSILYGKRFFNVVGYTGSGASNPITGVGFQPDAVFAKHRLLANSPQIANSVTGPALSLRPNTALAEAASGFTSFDVDGFTLNSDAGLNTAAATGVAWCWKRGSTPGFDVVAYTGNNTAGRTIAHALGAVPAFIIVKNRGAGVSWPAYHRSTSGTPQNDALHFDSQSSTSGGYWNNTAPTSSVFSVGAALEVNASANSYVAYLWAEIAGFSRFGSYVGAGSTDGPFVWCGFRPAFVLVKCITTTGNWAIVDRVRNGHNDDNDYLLANSANSEADLAGFDILSNGFRPRTLSGLFNGSQTYVFAAFAEYPFKYAVAR